ncbi:uncharacterized WD repeat-containing protein alr3466 [Phtheirospermum japonicum]|uniref:Uncharacterized WD repeat-containing protein alr3466 n=1 Tax=Phtheirospermum japonicum TaxID=374723 RepID=A0A830BRB4_9LAMI|nr:uncharacterized WD repeat-containing protein alr3466 [Phtheirospermum japonicum]
MEEFQSWPSSFTNYNPVLSSSLSLSSPSSSSSSSSFSPTISQEEETRSTPTLCEDTSSFNSLESNINNKNNNNNSSLIPKLIISHPCILSTKTNTPQINCLALRNNALYAATAREIKVYDPKTLALTGTFGPGSGLAKSIAFCGERIFTAHQDRKIRVWKPAATSSSDERQKHRLVSTLPTFKDRAFNCMLPRNYVRVRRHEQRLWIEHADAVSGLAVDSDVGLMYSVSWDKCFKIWRISSGPRCLESVKAHSDAVNAIVVSPVDRTVYTGSADGEIKIWAGCGDSKGYKLVTTLNKHVSSVNALALADNGSGLCSAGGDGVILVWERNNNNCCLEGHKGAVLCLVHVKGVLISGSSDRTVRIWGLGKDNFRGCLAIFEGHCNPVKALVANDDDLDESLSVFSGSLDGDIRAWKFNISHASI